MSKYVFQLRRGWKWDVDPETGKPRNDWADYEAKPNHMKPLEGELVLEYDNGIPRLKIGDGVSEFSALPYMSIDSFITPTPTFITLYGGDAWVSVEGFERRYAQDITEQLAGKVTVNSKIDMQPTPEQLYSFQAKDVTFTTINEGGRVRVCVIGERPMNDYEDIQITITEVISNG